MKTNEISNTIDPDVLAALGALHRAALQARKIAIQTETNLVIVKDGQLLRIPPSELRQQMEERSKPLPCESN